MYIETAIALVLVFGALVMFHELGHFIAARLCGIRVDEFAIGFGPKIARLFKRGDTEYTIHPIPMGGFVKLAGMEPGEEDVPNGFNSQPAWKRAFVIFCGPFASFVLAVLVFLCLGAYWGFPDDSMRMNRVAMVQPKTVAAAVGLRAGDRILAVDGVKLGETDGNRMTDLIHAKPGQRIHLLVRSNGTTKELSARTAWNIRYLGVEWSFMNRTQGVVDRVLDSKTEQKLGIKPKDVLVSINGQRIRSGDQMARLIEENGTKPVSVQVRRDGKLITAKAKPEIEWVTFMGAKWAFPSRIATTEGAGGVRPEDKLVSINGATIGDASEMARLLETRPKGSLTLVVTREQKRTKVVLRPSAKDYASLDAATYDANGLLGFLPEPVFVRTSLSDSVRLGLVNTWHMIVLMFESLSPSQIGESVGGPVLIAKHTSSMVALGVYYVVRMAGMLSLSLAVVNLLPIPVLDGGHLAILAIEAVRRRPLTIRQKETATVVGLALIITLALVVVWSDFAKITSGSVPQ